MNRQEICDWLEQTFPDEEFLLADGLEEAFVGVDMQTMKTMYDSLKVIDILMKDSVTYEDALDHFYTNICGAYVGEKTPIFLYEDFIYNNEYET
jgi:hypothetical protein